MTETQTYLFEHVRKIIGAGNVDWGVDREGSNV